jgi:hypothetical protein
MRTISGVASNRATVRRHTARVDGVDDWADSPSNRRLRLPLESPLGLAAVCLFSLLVMTSALLPFRFAPFRFALQSLIGLSAVEPPPADARIGAIVFTPFDGNACRKVLFDNTTGAFGPDQHMRCYVPGDREAFVARASADRRNLIRQAFSFPGSR